MGIETSRDANRLIEDIELELASIRAAMALRPLEPQEGRRPPADAAAPAPAPAVRQIGPFDLSRRDAAPTPAAPPPAAATPAEPAKRMTLQERLASMQDTD